MTLQARGGVGRERVDQGLANLEILELPAARGCTYLVPSSHFALALKVGQGFNDESDRKTARKLGVDDAEIDALCEAVVNALGKVELEPERLRAATEGAWRNLGEQGKKRGLGTTLPVALAILQSAGEIRRIPTNGRLDQQRYRYRLWRPNPLDGFRLSSDEARVELARLYFKWAGPASLREFQWFSGLGVKAAKAAIQPLGLETAPDGERRMFPGDREAFERSKVPSKPSYQLVGSLDGLFLLRRDVTGLVGLADLNRPVPAGAKVRELGSLSDLTSHAIVDRGRLVGLWEYDVETESIVWMSFGVRDKALREAVRETEDFIRRDLGDARSFSLDSPKSRRPRIEALRNG